MQDKRLPGMDLTVVMNNLDEVKFCTSLHPSDGRTISVPDVNDRGAGSSPDGSATFLLPHVALRGGLDKSCK